MVIFTKRWEIQINPTLSRWLMHKSSRFGNVTNKFLIFFICGGSDVFTRTANLVNFVLRRYGWLQSCSISNSEHTIHKHSMLEIINDSDHSRVHLITDLYRNSWNSIKLESDEICSTKEYKMCCGTRCVVTQVTFFKLICFRAKSMNTAVLTPSSQSMAISVILKNKISLSRVRASTPYPKLDYAVRLIFRWKYVWFGHLANTI